MILSLLFCLEWVSNFISYTSLCSYEIRYDSVYGAMLNNMKNSAPRAASATCVKNENFYQIPGPQCHDSVTRNFALVGSSIIGLRRWRADETGSAWGVEWLRRRVNATSTLSLNLAPTRPVLWRGSAQLGDKKVHLHQIQSVTAKIALRHVAVSTYLVDGQAATNINYVMKAGMCMTPTSTPHSAGQLFNEKT